MGLSGPGREPKLQLGLYPLNGHGSDNLSEKPLCLTKVLLLPGRPSPHRPLGKTVLRDNLSSGSAAGERGRDVAGVRDLLLPTSL